MCVLSRKPRHHTERKLQGTFHRIQAATPVHLLPPPRSTLRPVLRSYSGMRLAQFTLEADA
jgi:hypothetical protein